ncbi:DUF2188 domain-containing protein [Fundicoccus culcitae]|uniref:DUF2188 domain-containing protein n=1 Tax=Fundicoccus culcitae TaxID=2969821 RepID=A0ABY5P7Y6_9LACT|nr:DUF2188 domain-containing protein [Fundicoccus culcitae]UUX34696.1 DUF2188 domain-containing protein [Fundicoccus culcitae]
MPWNISDYPASMKNFEPLLRKKMIDMANAMVANGYEEDQAIPIAISQAKEWFENADAEEKRALEKEANPQKDDTHEISGNPDLLDEDVEVFFNDEKWAVKTVKAERADQLFDTKAEAVKRAKEIAANKGTQVVQYTKDGNKQ